MALMSSDLVFENNVFLYSWIYLIKTMNTDQKEWIYKSIVYDTDALIFHVKYFVSTYTN